MNPLEKLRRRRGLVTRLVAPLLCMAWLGAFGCPCVMAADMGQPAAHGHAAGHGPEGHHCPFCPAGDGQHSLLSCSAVHNAVDHVPHAFAIDSGLRHGVLPAPEPPAWAGSPEPARRPGRSLYAGVHAPPAPLNLRYCVFLN